MVIRSGDDLSMLNECRLECLHDLTLSSLRGNEHITLCPFLMQLQSLRCLRLLGISLLGQTLTQLCSHLPHLQHLSLFNTLIQPVCTQLMSDRFCEYASVLIAALSADTTLNGWYAYYFRDTEVGFEHALVVDFLNQPLANNQMPDAVQFYDFGLPDVSAEYLVVEQPRASQLVDLLIPERRKLEIGSQSRLECVLIDVDSSRNKVFLIVLVFVCNRKRHYFFLKERLVIVRKRVDQ